MLHEILLKLKTIEHLPSHHIMKKRIGEIISGIDLNTEAEIDTLAGFIACDPPLLMELLKIANSDAYGFKNRISSIKDALLILDNDLLRLVIEQHPSVPDLDIYGDEVNEEFIRLMKHSIEVHTITGILCKTLLEKKIIEKTICDDLLSASVIHDIGLYFILIYFPDLYFTMYNRTGSNKSLSRSHWRKNMPDHSITGSILGGYWNFTAFIKKTIAFHHNPWVQDAQDVPGTTGAEILYVSDSLSDSYYSLFYDENNIFTVSENIVTRKNLLDILEKLGIDIPAIPLIKNEAQDRMRPVFESLGI